MLKGLDMYTRETRKLAGLELNVAVLLALGLWGTKVTLRDKEVFRFCLVDKKGNRRMNLNGAHGIFDMKHNTLVSPVDEDWIAGPLMDSHEIGTCHTERCEVTMCEHIPMVERPWIATIGDVRACGSTRKEAALRALVVKNFGDTINLEQLVKEKKYENSY